MKSLAVLVVLMAIATACAAKDESQTMAFVNQHLNSIGTEQARAATKNLVAQGSVTFQVLNRGPQTWEGPATLVSEGDKLASLMKFPTTMYVRNGL